MKKLKHLKILLTELDKKIDYSSESIQNNNLGKYYNEWYKDFTSVIEVINSYSITQQSKSELALSRNIFQSLYNRILNLHYELSRVKNYDYSEHIKLCEIHINRVQFQYLYPINLALNKFAENRARFRDYILFGGAIVISTFLTVFSSTFQSIFKIKTNENVEKKLDTLLYQSDSLDSYFKRTNIQNQEQFIKLEKKIDTLLIINNNVQSSLKSLHKNVNCQIKKIHQENN